MTNAVEQFFGEHVPNRLAAHPQTFSLGRSWGFDIDGVGAWALRLNNAPTCKPSLDRRDPEVDCWLSLDASCMVDALKDPSKLRSQFAAGQVRVSGDLGVALHTRELFGLLGAPRWPSGIEQLFPEFTAEAFLRDWPDALQVSHGPLERIAEVAELTHAGLRSVHHLLAAWPGNVRLADRHWAKSVDAKTAADMYGEGFHLAFSEVERVFPVLRSTLAHLRWQLDLPISSYGRCLSYASPAGTGEDLHFDQNANVVVQLQGSKVWRVAPNQHIQSPTQRYTVANAVIADELKLAGVTSLPQTLPQEGARDIRLQPGSVLYVPRGYWHQTLAESDALSLNFTFDQPAWLDLLPRADQALVLPQVSWRALALGAGSANRRHAQRANDHLKALLATAPSGLRHLRAADLLAQLRPTEAAD